MKGMRYGENMLRSVKPESACRGLEILSAGCLAPHRRDDSLAGDSIKRTIIGGGRAWVRRLLTLVACFRRSTRETRERLAERLEGLPELTEGVPLHAGAGDMTRTESRVGALPSLMLKFGGNSTLG